MRGKRQSFCRWVGDTFVAFPVYAAAVAAIAANLLSEAAEMQEPRTSTWQFKPYGNHATSNNVVAKYLFDTTGLKILDVLRLNAVRFQAQSEVRDRSSEKCNKAPLNSVNNPYAICDLEHPREERHDCSGICGLSECTG
ncbi:hypothetical protein TWF192_002494 [Orbilia oligospora]|uniref:Uncharacterized protein n=1 Tax=Orbilia oligospora TaxID=2813651 RepID=A0A6G1LUL5_ORBOL|nr:hypothetical protein TWF191_002919 [Orbilia oligospora]KAF3233179.1 hypothetical protein TWF192_002494 [Orbilia oligospora]